MKIGTDIVQISRIEASLEKFGDRFKERFLNKNEIAQAKRTESLAGYWAAKEAIAKAIGCGIGEELGFHDIVITHDTKGSPLFTLSDKKLKDFTIGDSSLSISHDGGFAIAVVALEL